MGGITVLRLGHRIKRDQRISSHVALTARALGADEVVFSGEYDPGLIASVAKVVERWGGGFKVSYTPEWRRFLEERRSQGEYVVHLTMYGVGIQDVEEELRRAYAERGLVLVVGSSKVPIEVYELADVNVAVTNQPHSEVAALAVALDRIHQGRELTKTYPDARNIIQPSRLGKLRKAKKKEEIN
ncbi:MAG: tRNA (cytidine(56)-2'-O)-methyltransferase [Nitrososphaerota archaeon]|nr:tRNA (cytidine(56)-2'-O)-methyltransferase [Candidatus Calditenuaceae archaeon]MDW8074033.1 tRNA (cytidine(56)-2'-O)-methyltransferase [Nitrososphaerota archaeon]